MPKALKLRERVPAMANPHKSERILFQLFSNSVIVIVIVIVARMRVSRVGVDLATGTAGAGTRKKNLRAPARFAR